MKILVLCTGNSARSILLESILSTRGAGRIRAFSAGSHPAGRVHPEALRLLEQKGHDTAHLHSKSWDSFSEHDAETMDIVLTVCGKADQICPVWPGAPVQAHWGLPDPAAAPDADQPAAFADTYERLDARAREMLTLPLGAMNARALTQALAEIGGRH